MSLLSTSKITERKVSLMALTNKQKLFADEYLIDLNAARAYKRLYWFDRMHF